MTLAVEWAQFNILVNAVAPGIIISSGTAQYPPQLLERGIKNTPLKRAGTRRRSRGVDRVPRIAGRAVHHRHDAADRRRAGAVGPHLGDSVNLGLDGKAVLVAGASRGIGRAIALAFAREGARVAAVARGASRARCARAVEVKIVADVATAEGAAGRGRRCGRGVRCARRRDRERRQVVRARRRADGRRRSREVARHESVDRGAGRATRGAAPREDARLDHDDLVDLGSRGRRCARLQRREGRR